MASKKYIFLLGILCLMGLSAFSQAGIRSYEDSSVIPSSRLPQHTEFLNGTNNYPAKPRNQWEIGVKGGAFTVSGDVPALFPTPGFGLHVRKALGYVFSLRLEYLYGIGKGLHYAPATNYENNPAWASAYSAPNQVYYNYKTKVQDLSLQGIITLNNVRFHKAKTGMNIYGIFGVGGTVYDTKINALNGNTPYNFSGIQGGVFKDRKDTRKALKDLMDDSYETDADNHGDYRPKLFGQTFRPSGTVGAGLAFKLSNRINLAVENRFTVIKDDLLDGQRWQEHPNDGRGVLTRDYDSYNYTTVGLNFNLGSKAVEPLYWMNPLDYAYQEIRQPKRMILPKPVLPDADGDGVTDQFDQEQTPAGVPVDSHGVSRDTDGDGVPDSKDKELITPTSCQPVDADGVGKCPDPECCKNMVATNGGDACAAALGALPSVSFKPGSNTLSDDAKAVLATVASKIRNNPSCKVVVVGYCSSTKKEQQLSWDHVNKVISHLVEKEGISNDRFIFNYGQEGGDCNTVDLRAAGSDESGPNTVAPPHPQYQKK